MAKQRGMSIKPLRRLEQADLSNSVVHFTGRVGKPNTDVPDAIRKLDGRGRLANVLAARRINAYSIFFSCGDPVVCFTEATLEGMRTLVQARRYEPWGLEFSKDYIFQRGGGPAHYVRGDQWYEYSTSDLPAAVKALGTPYWPGVEWEAIPGNWVKTAVDVKNEWAHEREWRIAIGIDQDPCAMTFEYKDVAGIVAPNLSDGERLKQSLNPEVRAAVAAIPVVGLGDTGSSARREVVASLPLLDYESAIAIFQRLTKITNGFPGESNFVLEMQRSGGGVRRVRTSFKVEPSTELVASVMRELGDVVTSIELVDEPNRSR